MAARDAFEGVERRRAIRQLAAYFALAFAITWGLGAAVILARPQLESVVGPIGTLNRHWIYFLAVGAPTISAIVCSIVFGGRAGLAALARRFLRPVAPSWVLMAVVIWPAALAAFELAQRAAGGGGGIDLRALVVGAPVLALTTPALIVDPGGLGEEAGWRGYALPRLIGLMRPAQAGLALGLVWGLWHLPAFFLSDLAQSRFGLGWFLAASAAFSVVMTFIYVRANGNALVAGVIPHLVLNLLFDAHVFRRDPIPQEAVVAILLAAVLVAAFGPGFRGGARGAPQAGQAA